MTFLYCPYLEYQIDLSRHRTTIATLRPFHQFGSSFVIFAANFFEYKIISEIREEAN